MECQNCNAESIGNYCSNCGQALKLKRIDLHYVGHEISHSLHFERGILYTIRALLITPGKSIRSFLSENRSKLVKPLVFIIVTSLVYSLVSHYFHYEEKYLEINNLHKSNVDSIFKWLRDNYGYANIIMGFFIAFWTKVFFRKHNYNFFEMLVLLCYVMGIGMLIFAVFAIIQGLSGYSTIFAATAFGFLYCIWAIAQFFGNDKFNQYLKAFAAYMLGMITYMVAFLLVGLLLDLILK